MANKTPAEIVANEIALLSETLHGKLASKLSALRDEAAIDAAKRKIRVAKATLNDAVDLEVKRSVAQARALCNLSAEDRAKLEAAALVGKPAPAPAPKAKKAKASKANGKSAPATPAAPAVVNCG